MFNSKTRERKFKAFLLIYITVFIALMLGTLDQDTFKVLAIFCGGFYGGVNLATKVVGIFHK